MSSFKPIRTLVAENQAVAPMLGQLARISRLQKTYADTIPASLCASSRVAAVEGTTLIIAATNGAAASLLKQLVPRLLVKIQKDQRQVAEITAIRVIVQPDATGEINATARHRRHENPGAPRSDAALEALTGALPDSPLKETLTRIQKKRVRALTNKKRG
jgi:hypothetical protein